VLDQPHAPVHAREVEVLAREGQGVHGHVHRGHPRVRHLVRDGQRDRAGARADVQHFGLAEAA